MADGYPSELLADTLAAHGLIDLLADFTLEPLHCIGLEDLAEE